MTLKREIGKWLFPHLPVSRFVFDIMRRELNAKWVSFENHVFPSRIARVRKLRKSKNLYCNVACGPFPLDGFVNIDLVRCAAGVIPWDCRTTIPLGDNSAKGIRAKHFVEHIEPRQELPSFLRDCRRALEPGGVLRVIVPDAERYLHAYCRVDNEGFREIAVPIPFPDDLPRRMDVVNHVFHQWDEHRWGYDFETLEHRLKAAGFGKISKQSFQQSHDPLLAQDRAEHAPYSLYVDAVKPE